MSTQFPSAEDFNAQIKKQFVENASGAPEPQYLETFKNLSHEEKQVYWCEMTKDGVQALDYCKYVCQHFSEMVWESYREAFKNSPEMFEAIDKARAEKRENAPNDLVDRHFILTDPSHHDEQENPDQLRLKSLLETANDEKMRPFYRNLARDRAEKLQAKMMMLNESGRDGTETTT